MKKFFITLLATFFAISLVGCGNSSNNITKGINIENIDNEYVSLDYPSDKWQAINIEDFNEYTPLILKYNDSDDIYISVTVVEAANDLESFFEETKTSLDSLELDVITAELRNIDNREMFYIEFLMPTYSEEGENIISEAISICVLNNQKFIIINAYANDSEKEDIVQAMDIIAQTIEIK